MAIQVRDVCRFVSALSTIEAKFIVITKSSKEMFWMKRFFKEIGLMQDKHVVFSGS